MSKKIPILGLNVGNIYPAQNPVSDLNIGKYTEISLVNYCITRGVIMRIANRDENLLAYCSQNPAEVFQELFPKFHVTRYNGRQFFGTGDFDEDTPMTGLSIRRIEPVKGIVGSALTFANEGLFEKVARKEPVSKKQIEKIIGNFGDSEESTSNLFLSRLDPNSNQNKYERQQIIEMLKPYLI